MSMPLIGNSGDAAAKAALAKAKAVYTQASQSLTKQQELEKLDSNKAKSIFTQAEQIEQNATQKTTNIKTKVDANIEQAKQKVDTAVQEIKANEEVIKNQTKLLDEKMKKKAELESAHPELKKMDASKFAPKPTETSSSQSKQQQPKIGADGKPIPGNQQQASAADEGGGSAPSGDMSYVQEYMTLCNEIGAINQILTPAQTKFNAGKEQLSGLNDSYKNTVDSGVQEFTTHVQQTDAKLQDKQAQYNQLINSQAQSKGVNDTMSSASEQAKTAADSAKSGNVSESVQEQLTQVSKNLGEVKGNTDKLSQTNNAHITTDFPKYQSDIQQKNKDIKSDANREAEKLQKSYNEYMTANIQPYLNKDAPKAEGGNGDFGKDLAGNLAGKAGNLAKGALNGADMGDMMKDMLVSTGMDMAKSALNNVLPGLGAGLDMLGSIFGGFF